MKDVSGVTKCGLFILILLSLSLVTILVLRARRVDRLFPPQELKVIINEQNR